MRKRLLLVGAALAALRFPEQLCAQFTDPRTYDNTPVGVNQLELGYGYVHSNTSIDTSIIVAGARFDFNQGSIDYTRYFSFLHRLAWVEPLVPVAGLSGSISGTHIQGSTTGAGDASCQIAMLLKGGPSLSSSQFANYKPTTTIGASLTVTAPTGQYNPDKLLNLGSDRWSFKPEIGVSHPFGPEQKWEVDAYANIYFYTDNTSYRGTEVLRQEPLPGLEGHISYSLTNNLWASLDTRYSFRGDTFVNGANQNDPQENFILGSELNLSLNSQNALVFEVGRALVHVNGSAYTGFAVRYDYSWAKSYK